MQIDQMQNAIRVNMRGFLPGATKRFVLCENETGSDEFTVTLIHGEFVEHTVVYSRRESNAYALRRAIFASFAKSRLARSASCFNSL